MVVSGVRMSESTYRKSNLHNKNFISDGVAEVTIYNVKALTLMPILSWSTADVIKFLRSYTRWDGRSYEYLLNLYGFNSFDEQLADSMPITVRFGCWTCTVIRREKMPLPQPLLEAKRLLIQVAKKDPRYREKVGDRLGKLNIEGRKTVAKTFLQALQRAPEAFGYNVERLERCLRTAIDNYGEASLVCKDLF